MLRLGDLFRPKLHKKNFEGVAGPINGFGAPLQIVYAYRQAGVNDPGAMNYAYLTLLLPRYTPIGGGIPNKRDIGTSKPLYSKQGTGLTRLGDPGIISGAFVSGPLTNTSSNAQAPAGSVPNPGSFMLPAN